MCVVCLSAAEKRKTIPTFIRKKRRALLLTTRRGLIFQGTLRLVFGQRFIWVHTKNKSEEMKSKIPSYAPLLTD